MAAESSVENLRDEATCSICLDFFRDPVMVVGCGHNFCRACITQCWEGAETDVTCPQCRQTFPQGTLGPNRQLGNLVELVKGLSVRPAEAAGGQRACGEHGEALKLFCQDDEIPICVVCDRSRVHRAYNVVPLEEAVEEYKDIRKTLSRYERGEIPQPVPTSFELERRLQDFFQQTCALTETVRKFKDILPSVQEKRSGDVPQPYTKVMVTLDPDTAHPKLILSADGRSVTLAGRRQHLPDNPERFDFESFVLGCEELSWGRHYHEVKMDVDEGNGWGLDVARDTVRRKGEIKISPKEGFWGVLHWWGNQIQVLTASAPTCVHLPQEPSRVRVCLHYAEGLVSFFDADTETPIFTFPPASFTGDRIWPWFCLRLQPMLRSNFDSGQLRLRP